MKTNFRLPFQGMTVVEWQNLALLAIFVTYLIEFLLDVIWGILCGYFGADYCALSSAGHIANTQTYANIYNLDILAQIQKLNFPLASDPSNFVVNPVPYLPVFIFPFQLFPFSQPGLGYSIWVLINLIGLVIYLFDFIKKTTGSSLTKRNVVLILLSLPVFLNLMCGQVNVWLVICAGEFLKAQLNKKPFIAGLWLGGLLLKPQTLILAGIVLLLQRSLKTITGLALSTAIISGLSFILIGISGLKDLFWLWTGYAKGLATNSVEVMVNWRMVGFHVGNITNELTGTVVVSLGMVITILGVCYLWYRPLNTSSPYYAIAFLGTLAATSLSAWHSHIHMVMIMIPLLLYAFEKDILPKGMLELWVLLPAVIYMVTMLVTAFTGISANDMGPEIRYPRDFLRGFSIFLPNLVILYWAIIQIRKLHLKAN
jgi:hypothetical protein